MIKVLIVEDDPMVAEFNRRYLAKVNGFVLVASARSAHEALAILEKCEVDLILLDIFMPGINGLELLTQLRTAGKGIDVIVVTAASDSHSIKEALRYGAVDYLIKPFEFERLNDSLLAYLDRVKLMENNRNVNQFELDQYVLYKEQSVSDQLPKGLDRNTLRIVWENLQEIKEAAFTTEEIANRVGISRVSIRKYLEFLTSLEALKREVYYGSIGRPVAHYRCVVLDSSFVRRYL